MSELNNLIWVEKYRPKDFENLILEEKSNIVKYLENPKAIPSFIFYSSKPGTGKTSTAKLIIITLQCDYLIINSSDERGIDVIREKIKLFSRSLSSNEEIKRCVFLDEADGLTKQAQDSLRNLMEEYSDNCFFIFTANDINKIIEPLRSRCQVINFERPNKTDIVVRLKEVVEGEKLSISDEEIDRLIEKFYPDIRSMINRLQKASIEGKSISEDYDGYSDFLNKMNKKDVKGIYDIVYSGDFDIMGFNRWLFHKTFLDCAKDNFEKCRYTAVKLADTEKNWNLGVNLEIVFIANILDLINKTI